MSETKTEVTIQDATGRPVTSAAVGQPGAAPTPPAPAPDPSPAAAVDTRPAAADDARPALPAAAAFAGFDARDFPPGFLDALAGLVQRVERCERDVVVARNETRTFVAAVERQLSRAPTSPAALPTPETAPGGGPMHQQIGGPRGSGPVSGGTMSEEDRRKHARAMGFIR